MEINEAKQYVTNKTAAIWQELQQSYNCGTMPEVSISLAPTKWAGFAWRSGTKIEINLAYVMSHSLDNADATIAHELAHIVQYRCFPKAKQAHGKEFRSILDCLFMDNSTHHYMSVSAAKNAAKKLKDEFDADSI